MGRVEGKVAFITGAGRGQGRSHAIRLAEEGADIIAVDIIDEIDVALVAMATAEQLADTAAEVEARGRRCVAVKCDVRDLDRLRSVVDDAVVELGGLDIVVANAGITTIQPWDEVTPAIWQTTIDVCLTGVWHTCAVSIPHLIERGGGSIIIASSVGGLKGLPFITPYVAAKHGVQGIMASLANELAEQWIRVNTVHPTGVATGMTGEEGTRRLTSLLASHPLLGPLYMNALAVPLVESEDVSHAVVFLASDESRYVTGTELKVDAGATLR